MEGTITSGWYQKLLGFGVPVSVASRMAYDLDRLGYSLENYSTLDSLAAVMMRDDRITQLDWWSDLMAWLNQLLATLQQITPGIISTVAGGAIVYFLRNVKIRNIPIGLIGLIPLGFGIYNIIQPLLQPPTE